MDYKKLDNYRKEKNLTQAEIAMAADISVAGYQQMIYKEKTTVHTLEKVSAALGVSPAFWWKGNMVEKIMTVEIEKKMENLENLNEHLKQDHLIQISVIKNLTNYIDLLEKRMKNKEKKNVSEGLEEKEYQYNT